MDDDIEGVLVNIRACIGSLKGGSILVRNLKRDYETLMYSPIPYQKFNHPTLESFLQSLPSLRVTGIGRDAVVEVAKDSSSSHISSMIAKQKSTKKRDNYIPPQRGHYASRGNRRGRGYQPIRNYVSRENSVPLRRYSPDNTSSTKRYSPDTLSSTKRYSPDTNSSTGGVPQNRKDSSNSIESLVVKVDGNDRRQVSVDTYNTYKPPSSSIQKESRPKYELPPRLQKLQSADPNNSPNLNSLAITDEMKVFQRDKTQENLEDNSDIIEMPFIDFTSSSNTIISPLSPGVLVAAGRAKQALANYPEFPTQEVVQEKSYFENQPNVDDSVLEQPEDLHLIDVPEPDTVFIPNNINLLKKYAIARNWDIPEYLVFTRTPKGCSPELGAKVKIMHNGCIIKLCSTYPHEYRNKEIAKGHAAKIALEEIIKENEKFVNTTISSDKDIISFRVSEIVAGVYNGMFVKSIEDKYIEKYQERLPDDWIQHLEGCPTLSVEPGVNSIIIVPRQPVANETSHEPPTLDLPTGEDLDVYVTHSSSVDSVWFRIIGENYSEEYEELLQSMDDYFKNNSTKELAVNIEEGHYYAGHAEDGWFRVCVSEIEQGANMATALLIDHGDNDIFSFSNLFRLPAEFCKLPRQAVECSLEGLEMFTDRDESVNKILIEELNGKTLIAQIKFKEERSIKVIFFDTSGNDDVNINQKLLDSIICSNGKPTIPAEGTAKEVYVSIITERGEVYVQTKASAFEHITQVLNSLGETEILKHKLTNYRQVKMDKIYLAKYSKDGCWYRAVVTAVPSVQFDKIIIQFVDYGNSDSVSMADIADVDNLPPIISNLPPQALKVGLHNLPAGTLTNSEIAKLHSMLLDIEKVVLIKTVNKQVDPPIVEIFFKNEDNALVSVNNTIIFNRPEENKFLQNNKTSFDVNSHKFSLESHNKGHDSLSNSLQPPTLDKDFMEVYIILSASPYNFTFHPMKYMRELDNLMFQMQAYYEVATSLPELTKDTIIKGGLYAGKFTDDNWYRVVVTNLSMIGSNVPIRFCDHGDLSFISINNLRDLELEFRQVPFVGVKGKLAGVVPLHTDWSVEDCIRFQKLVVNRRLAAEVKNVEDNFTDPMEMVVSLHLTDTSTEKDQVISEILINENRARKVNT